MSSPNVMSGRHSFPDGIIRVCLLCGCLVRCVALIRLAKDMQMLGKTGCDESEFPYTYQLLIVGI